MKNRHPRTAKLKQRKEPIVARRPAPSAVNLDTEHDERTIKLAAAQKHLAEALEQQKATSEILDVVARSRSDVQPVLDAVAQSATKLCKAYDAAIWLPDGDQLRLVAHHGPIPVESIPRVRGNVGGRSVLDKKTIHIVDVQTENDEFPVTSKNAKKWGFRTVLCVPLMRDDVVFGAIALRRTKAQLFNRRQVALLQTFAAQAVIAIENTRLLNELRQRTDDLSESLEQQTATSEVLKVVSSSPGDLKPVFETMLENATRICEANFGSMYRYADGLLHLAAMRGVPPALADFLRQRGPFAPQGGIPLHRLVQTRQVIHTIDQATEQNQAPSARFGGARSHIAVPMLKDNELVGAITIYRTEVRPFTEKQIELVQNFAAQAVIAIENTRLLNELRESLQQQTATSEVLSVISSSPGELEPVFKALLENATRLCGASFGLMHLREGAVFRRAATHNIPPALAAWRSEVIAPVAEDPLGQITATKQNVHITDARTVAAYKIGFPPFLALVDDGGARTVLAVPLLKEDELIGALTIYRQEVRAFDDKHIALVANFAAQAVIAIENARLLSELRQRTDDLGEALEQQTATSEVLKVISSSPGDLQPAFQAMLENAVRICKAEFGTMFRFDSGMFYAVATLNAPSQLAEFIRKRGRFVPEPGIPLSRLLETKKVIHTVDDASSRDPSPSARFGGARSHIAVPMLKDNELAGAIIIYRQEVRPFTDKQIELVQNFAAQAVIAIENTRLLNELRESLQQQTATADVLKVISRSTFDLQPVLDTLIESACRLCRADRASIRLVRQGAYHSVAMYGFSAQHAEYMKDHPTTVERSSIAGRAVLTGRPVQVEDVTADPELTLIRAAPGFADVHTLLAVPILREEAPIGVLILSRERVEPFTKKQIELVNTFADQAGIAIENARLLNELRESLQQQTATAEVLRVISSSPGELQPIFDTMLAKASALCEASYGLMWLSEGDAFRTAALHGDFPQTYVDLWRRGTLFRPGPTVLLARVAISGSPIQVADLRTDASYLSGDPLPVAAADVAGIRTLLAVPMLKDKQVVGAIGIYRTEIRPFTDKQIELVTNFAAQAVIAIENARLLNELRQRTDALTESLEQQTATSEVLKVISRSKFDLQPILQSVVDTAVRLCRADQATLSRVDGNVYRFAAGYSLVPEYLEIEKATPILSGPGTVVGRAAMSRDVARIDDAMADPEYEMKGAAAIAQIRSMIGVPLMREGEPIGVIALARCRVEPFTDREIELVTTFADQAVIAIENVKLFDDVQKRTAELSEALEQQTATSEVLKVISSSPGELEPVFSAMLENATRICDARFGILFKCEGNIIFPLAYRDVPPELVDFLGKRGPLVPGRGTTMERLLKTGQIIHVDDLAREGELSSPTARLGGARSYLGVPMIKDDEVVGAFNIYRQNVQPFTDKQIELVQNFAAQAVIAIENTRLLNELRESLQQQTATADVLKVISSSKFDLQPVFDTMAESAVRLCEAERAYIFRFEGKVLRAVASFNAGPENQDWVYRNPIPLGRHSVSARAGLERRTVQVADVQTDPEYNYVARDIDPIRTTLAVPMLKGDELIGTITIYRLEVKPFTENQIALMETFADQAVIAIENVRLFDEVQKRTQELSESLEDLRTAQDRLVQTQKLASLGQLTAGIAHEIKNPLNFVNNFSSLSTELLDELQGSLKRGQFDDKTRAEIDELTDTLRANLDKIEQHGKRADSIVKNMLLHSREGSGEHRPIDINAVVEESLNLAYHGARAEKQSFNITLERSFDPAAGEVDLFPQEITRVLLNLISNGFYAATKRKAEAASADGYEPTLTATTKNLGDRVEIRIRDNGTGIPSDVKDKMFNPFFTTKPPGEGTGLGLSLSHDIIVKQHAGLIEVDTKPGEFTEFRIILPRSAASIAKSGGRA